ncbi:MAG TPA: hypothetical protein VGM90_06280 [Kofleriaceae bacterium]
MKVVTIATDLENTFLRRLLAPSCASLGFELEILHPNERWKSFADKRPAMIRYLAQLPPDELLIFTDAYDTVFVRGPDHVAAAHAALGGRIAFSAEPNCWPLGVLGFALYGQRAAGTCAYLNSGGFIGRAGELLELYHRYPTAPADRFELLRNLKTHGFDANHQFGWSDQYYWTLVHLLEPETVALDRDTTLFECHVPLIPNVVVPQVMKDVAEVQRLGRASPAYHKELPRLVADLQEQRRSAHLHFASSVSKLVVGALLDEGGLPPWIARVLEPQTGSGAPRIHEL